MTITQYPTSLVLTKVKIHHNIFQNEGHAIVANGPVCGVTYSNTFINVGNPFKIEGGNSYSWENVSKNYGNDSSFYFENNNIYAIDSVQYMTDLGGGTTGQGGSVVCRYNIYNYQHSDPNLLWDEHGLQSMTNAHGSCNASCPIGGVCYDSSCCNEWASIKAEYYGNIMTNVIQDYIG